MAERSQRRTVRGAWVARALAGGIAVGGSLLPAVTSPAPFERLRVDAVRTSYGRIALFVGVLLVLTAVVPAARRMSGWGWWSAAAAVVLGAATGWGCWEVDGVLSRQVPGVGVHPGRPGPAIPVLAVAAAVTAVAALLDLRPLFARPPAGTARDR